MSRKLHIKTYGCQMNVYDSRRMADTLAAEGFVAVDAPDAADLVILNTCHIREKAAEKVYSDIGRLRALKERREADGGRMVLAVAGCVAQAEGAEIMRRAPAVEMVFGPQTYHRLPELTRAAFSWTPGRPRPRLLDTEFPAESKFDSLPKQTAETGPSAFLTIQEGCDKFCTFCVVPYTRGAEFSRPLADVVAEARRLVAAGAREITLLGQNVNAYHGRADSVGGEVGLGGLIRRLSEIDGLARIRYTTSHPRDMDDELIDVHRSVAACMPYLHLPVQSGSDRILAAMNRRHTADDYRRIVGKLRKARPDIALSSDFIVGFPGESDADFAATMTLVSEVGFAQAYSFKYSPRPGTPAAESDDQVPEAVKRARLAELQGELNRQQQDFNRATVGRRLPVLLERVGKRPGQLVGRSPYMQAVHLELADGGQASCNGGRIGQIMELEIVAAGPNSLEGRAADVADRRPAA